MSAEQVILVVDRSYGARLCELSSDSAIWFVDSVVNHPWLAEVKKKFTPEVRSDLSWFVDIPGVSPAERAASMIDTLEDHHGEYSQRPAYSRLKIIGAALESPLRSAVESYGFRLVSNDGAVIEFER
jgi:hypothetical protein